MKIPGIVAYSKIWAISNFYKIIYKIFLEHPNSTDNPQGYLAHGIFSGTISIKLVGFGLLGVIHGIIPCVFKFSTSSYVIRSFVILARSNRHKKEIKKYVSQEVLNQLSSYNKSSPIVQIITCVDDDVLNNLNSMPEEEEKYDDESYELDTSTWD